MPITFTSVDLPFGWLGNMSRHALKYKRKTWRSAEALFQALRFKNAKIREAIREQKSPMWAKFTAKGHADKMTVVPESAQDLANMELVLRLKLKQHPDLKDALLATGHETIIEDVSNRPAGGRHAFWGMALVGGEWKGDNALGKLWMKLREELRNERE
jgi:predicted NAD-dependent protein-ADP-ribosyltransferase YbiA (DUF1768 family)